MKNRRASLPAIPYVGWMAIFVVAPLVLIVVYAFTGNSGAFTTENFSHMGDYVGVFARSMWLALIATVICLLVGYPLAYAISKERPSVQRVMMMLIMLPMWMNFLLRTYAWMSILENTGLLNHLFAKIGLISLVNHTNGFLNGALGSALPTNLSYFKMINTEGAVVLGMVYNFLPFMVLPIHSVIVKIDRRVVEAAQDLGADGRTTFRRVIFPLSLPGVLSGVTMVFVPAVSTFVISKLLGGGGNMLLGDLIEMQFLGTAYNPHLGSAISLLMMIIVMICMAVMNRFGEGEEQAVML